jgi:hypothetical protein
MSAFGTRINTNAQIVVGMVEASNRAVNISGNATDLSSIAAGQIMCIRNIKGESMVGLDGQATNTGSLFNINATTYGIWRPNIVNQNTTPASVLDLHKAVNQGVGRGLTGDLGVYVSNFVFEDLVDDTTGLRRFTEDTKSNVTQGTMSLDFYGANGGKFSIIAHPMVKCGDAFGVRTEDLIRGGDSDLKRGLPGMASDDFFFHKDNVAGCEMRNFSSQFLLHPKPSQLVKLYAINPRSMA